MRVRGDNTSMSKFYEDPEFKVLSSKWASKLKIKGFDDIENKHGVIQGPNTRTATFSDREAILDFFLMLDALMTHYEDMPKFERQVMKLYSGGIEPSKIAKRFHKSPCVISRIIRRYRGLVIAIRKLQLNARNP